MKITHVTGEFGDLNVRGVSRALLRDLKHAATEEGLSLKAYIIQVLEMATVSDLDTYEIKTRAWQMARYRRFR